MINNIYILKEFKEEIIDQLVNIYYSSFNKFNFRIWSSQDFIDLINNGTNIFYSLSQNKITGFVAVSFNEEFSEIISIAVENDYQRRGIGSNLLNYIINRPDFVGNLIIDVAINNEEGIKFYESFGFKIIGKRKKYYLIKNVKDKIIKVDANIMQLLLK
jgi:ribosomal-protein-alanine N-acetyltransferase